MLNWRLLFLYAMGTGLPANETLIFDSLSDNKRAISTTVSNKNESCKVSGTLPC